MLFKAAVVAVIYIALFQKCTYSQIELIPERAGVYEINKKYLKYAKYYVNRYGRKSNYYAHMEFETYGEINNNLTIEFIVFEKLGNEYKRSFLELKKKACDLFNEDQFIGPTVRAAGVTCPVPWGDYHMVNLTLKRMSFPYKWPFEYARGDIILYQTETKEAFASAYLYFRMKQLKTTKRLKP